MRHKKMSALLLAIIFIFMLIPGFAAAVSTEDETVIHIFHTNDIRGHALGNETSIGYGRFQAMIKEDSADGRLILDAGNAFSGSAFANLSNGESISSIMDQTGYDAFTPGTHDFDYGSEILRTLVSDSGAKGLASNVLYNDEPLFEPYRIFERNGIRLGVIGITSPDTVKSADPRNLEGVNFLSDSALLSSVQSMVNDLRAQNVNAVIALSSLGTSENTKTTSIDLATGTSGIDLIIDSGSHSAYETGYISYPGYVQDRTPMIVQTDGSFETFGITELSFDANNALVGINERLVDAKEASAFSPNKKISETIIEYERQQQPLMERQITYSPTFLNAEPAYIHSGSTNFGFLCTQAMLQDTGADIALLNSGSISASIPEGPVSFGAFYNALPFDYNIVTTNITGMELKKLLNQHLLIGENEFPQFSGIQVVGQKYLNENGQAAVAIQSIKKEGIEISDTDQFTVAVLDSMYYGSEGYEFAGPLKKETSTLFDAASTYLNNTPADDIIALSHRSNLAIWEETIDADEIVSKLETPISDSVHVYLNQPSIVPESVIYPLLGQQRDLMFSIYDERPYSFIFNGTSIPVPMNINLNAGISQEAPQGKRTASSADNNAIFFDLAKNDAIPPGTHVSIYVGDVYNPGSLVYIYYYDLNRDILPVNESGITVDQTGNITFPVSGGTTYLLNSKLLNAATVFENPSAEHPYTFGIALLIIIFVGWVVFFLLTKKGAQRNISKKK